MGEAHPFVSGCPQLSIIRPSSPGALDPKKQYSGTPTGSAQCGKGDRVGPGSRAKDSLRRALVLPSHCHCWWRRAGEGAAATPEPGHIRKQNLSQCFSPFYPRGLSLGVLCGSGAVGIARSHSCLPQRHSSPGSPRVSVLSRLYMLHRPPWALPTMGVGRCELGTYPLCVPAPGPGWLC